MMMKLKQSIKEEEDRYKIIEQISFDVQKKRDQKALDKIYKLHQQRKLVTDFQKQISILKLYCSKLSLNFHETKQGQNLISLQMQLYFKTNFLLFHEMFLGLVAFAKKLIFDRFNSFLDINFFVRYHCLSHLLFVSSFKSLLKISQFPN